MKHFLASSIVGLGLTSTVFGGPAELHEQLLKEVPPLYQEGGEAFFEKTRKIPSPSGTSLEVCASTFSSPGETNRSLAFILTNALTEIRIVDTGANGLSIDDMLTLRHRFSTGEQFDLTIRYQGRDNYELKAICSEKGIPFYSMHKSMQTFTWAYQELIQWKLKPALTWGGQIYADLVYSAEQNTSPLLPYGDVRMALVHLECCLPVLRQGEKKAHASLVVLIKDYLTLAQERVEKKQNKRSVPVVL